MNPAKTIQKNPLKFADDNILPLCMNKNRTIELNPRKIRNDPILPNPAKTFRKSILPLWKIQNRELKQTDAVAANLQIPIQKDTRPNEFSRPLTSITLNLNRDLPVDRRRVRLLKLPNDPILSR